MKAMVMHELGGPVKLEERDVPKPGHGEALIDVKATGVGLTVVIMMANPDLVTSLPRVIGHEVAGVVAEVGPGVHNVKAGDRVTMHFYLTCGACSFCRSGKETLCENFRGFVGMACDGGYAEYMTIEAKNLCRIPDEVSFEDACIVADAVCTPYHACTREAKVKPGDNVLVIGAGGGVGIHMVQMANIMGARVLAADVTDEKLNLAKEWGAQELINPKKVDMAEEVLRVTDGKGANSIIDIVASKETLEGSMKSLAKMGKLVVIGFRPPVVFKADPSFVVDPLTLLVNGYEIHASKYVNLTEIKTTLETVRQGKVKPVITQRFPLEEAEKVHQLLRENKVAGRAVLLQE